MSFFRQCFVSFTLLLSALFACEAPPEQEEEIVFPGPAIKVTRNELCVTPAVFPVGPWRNRGVEFRLFTAFEKLEEEGPTTQPRQVVREAWIDEDPTDAQVWCTFFGELAEDMGKPRFILVSLSSELNREGDPRGSSPEGLGWDLAGLCGGGDRPTCDFDDETERWQLKVFLTCTQTEGEPLRCDTPSLQETE